MKHFGSTSGLTALAEDQATPANGMVAFITSSYNSGYQNGDIKGAFLSDTDDTDLVGSGELVTNGTFDTDTSGWTFEATATDSSAAGYLEGTTGGATNNFVYTTISTVVGKTYVAVVDNIGASNSVAILAGGSAFSSTRGVSSYVSPGKTATFTFIATTTNTYISIRADGASTTVRIDNVSVKLADADRSVNNKGLIVNGTVSRDPVSSGADLVGYSGFSASNYLEQPYNSDLDFGTGDFCVMGWVKTAANSDVFVGRYEASGSTPNWDIRTESNGYLRFKISGANVLTDTVSVTDGSWHFVSVVRTGGVAYLYRDGELTTSNANTTDLDNTSAKLAFGVRNLSTPDLDLNGSLALWRISATAPTAEQIAKIYNDEKVLFQENAQATLYGASDAVTALAHDPVTDLLHVGTSAGRSVFQGLRRVDNTTTAVGTAISASGGMVVEE